MKITQIRFLKIASAATALILSSSVNAAIYNSGDDPLNNGPYSLTLDTGSTPWQNQTQTLRTTADTYSGGSWTEVKYVYNLSPVIVDPKPGVEGLISYRRERITEYWSGGGSSQYAQINFSAKLIDSVPPQSTPSSYALAGTFTGSTYGLNFNMGLSNVFGPSYTGNAQGELSFFASNTEGDWTYSFHKRFDARSNNIGFSSSLGGLDTGNTVYYKAQYDIFGTTGDVFNINNLSLQISGGTSSGFSSMYNSVSNIELYQTSVIPALAAVPVPTAVWLFASGLLGLIGIARRKT